MKICFIASNIDVSNGSGRFAFSHINTLSKSYGIKPVIFIERGEKELLGAHAVLYSKGFVRKFICNPFIIASRLRRERVQLIHAFDAWPWGVWAYLVHLIMHIPFVMTIYATYGVYPLTRRFQGMLLRRVYRASSLNAAISAITAKKIYQYMPSAKIEVINQGIDFDYYQHVSRGARVVPNRYILTVAFMKARKGYHVALPIYAKIKRLFPDVKYVIRATGSSPAYFESIKKMARELAIEQDIIWLPKLDEADLARVYRDAEVFLLPSISSHPYYFEGFGSVYLEAQSCGTPVITSRGGGQEDALLDGESGILIPEGDIDAGVTAISKILESASVRQAFSKRALEFARSMDWVHTTKTYIPWYDKIVASR